MWAWAASQGVRRVVLLLVDITVFWFGFASRFAVPVVVEDEDDPAEGFEDHATDEDECVDGKVD